MFASFQAEPNLAPYECKPVEVDLEEKNVATAWGADKSKKMDFTKEDAADDLLHVDVGLADVLAQFLNDRRVELRLDEIQDAVCLDRALAESLRRHELAQ